MSDNAAINSTEGNERNSESFCPCGSDLPYGSCCGTPGRNALNAPLQAFVSNDQIEGEENLPASLKGAIANICNVPDLFPVRINYFERRAWFVKMSLFQKQSVQVQPSATQQ